MHKIVSAAERAHVNRRTSVCIGINQCTPVCISTDWCFVCVLPTPMYIGMCHYRPLYNGTRINNALYTCKYLAGDVYCLLECS